MIAVLRQRNFALLWLGQLISVIGDLTWFRACSPTRIIAIIDDIAGQ
jgi:hypothetical protein